MKFAEAVLCFCIFALMLPAGQSQAQITGFNPTYLLLGADSIDSPDDTQTECDVKFQISFSTLLSTEATRNARMVDRIVSFTGPLYLGYTQRSFWDICRESAPFRTTNYSPELFFKNTVYTKGLHIENFTGYRHESNGRDGDASRGWDRLFTRWRFPFGEKRKLIVSSTDTNEWVLDAQVWIPFSIGENNRRIRDYSGYGEFSATYTPSEKNRYRLALRKGGGFKDWDRGLATFDWIFEFPKTSLEMLIQYTNGYGDSLDRFDEQEWSLRVGFIFSDFNPPDVACSDCDNEVALQGGSN